MTARAKVGDPYLDMELSVENVDEVLTMQISPEFFHSLRRFREFQEILNDMDVSDEDQLDLFETLDVDGGGTIDLEELIVGISKLRGDARRSDIVGVSLIVRQIQGQLNQVSEELTHQLETQARVTNKFLKKMSVSIARGSEEA